MVFQKVSENVYAIVGYPAYANVTAFVLPKRVAIVDCGIQLPTVAETRREIEKISKRKVEIVVLTHFHSDHTRAVPAFSDCRIISSNLLFKNLKRANRKTPKPFKPMFPNETFDDQLKIDDGEIRLLIKRTGGHTDDSTYVYCPNYNTIVTGDNLTIDLNPWGGARNGDPDQWIQTLREYLSLNADYFIPGHGPVGQRKHVTELLDYIEQVGRVMKKMIASGEPEEDTLKAGSEIEYIPSRPAHPSTLKRWSKVWRARAKQVSSI